MTEENEALQESLPEAATGAGEQAEAPTGERFFTAGPLAGDALPAFRPQRSAVRKGINLCLSGGGYRAALFHLGVLGRLNELGVLSQITQISSVSGGSIIAAHVAATVRPWPRPGQAFPDWQDKVARPFLEFTARDIRTLPNLKMLLPWNFFKKGYNTKQLAKEYLQITEMKVAELPSHPVFTFCATDMTFGVNWEFTRDYIGDYQAGYVETPKDLPLAFAIAASSCFPPVFRPLPVKLTAAQLQGGEARKRQDYAELVASLRLTDGGNYDNLGLEPAWKKRAKYVLVSDGGGVFAYEPRSDWFWQLFRYIAISSLQSNSVRKRWHLANVTYNKGGYKGTYLGINSVYKNDPAVLAYSQKLVEEVIAPIRTDMDAFSEAERAVLENHGYLIAESQMQRKVPELVQLPADVKVPNPRWMPRLPGTGAQLDESHIREALCDSHKRTLGRLKF